MDQQTKAHVNSLLEDGWFFGNTLANNQARSSTSKMVRCFSDPCPCSSSKQGVSGYSRTDPDPKLMSNLLRTPSLPPSWGSREMKFSQEEERDEDEDEPSMGDLIRQAMPLPMPKAKPNLRRLDRTPSLPPCRSKVGTGSSGVAPTTQNNGPNGVVGRLTRRASIDSSVLLPEINGPNGMAKLSRRASIDSPLVLPPKYTSKGSKQGGSNAKNRPQRKLDLPNINIGPTKEDKISKQTQNQNKSKPQKNSSDVEIEELQGFKDLGLTFDNKQVISPSVAQVTPALQRRASIDSSSSFNGNGDGKVRRPSLSEAWRRSQSSSPLSAPLIPKRGDHKAQSAEDMKAQLKFWARAVAFNVHQEC